MYEYASEVCIVSDSGNNATTFLYKTMDEYTLFDHDKTDFKYNICILN